MLREDIANYLRSSLVRRGEEQVIHDAASAIPHRHRVWDELEPGHLAEAFLKSMGDSAVIGLTLDRAEKFCEKKIFFLHAPMSVCIMLVL